MAESDFFFIQEHLDTESKEQDKEKEDQLEVALSALTSKPSKLPSQRKDKNKSRDSLTQPCQEDQAQKELAISENCMDLKNKKNKKEMSHPP